MNFFGIGGFELIVIVGIAFFVLGPKKMIETSRSAGKLIRELKTERDKFTNLVMSEFEDKKPDAAAKCEGGGGAQHAASNDVPAGAVSRPRGRVSAPPQDVADAVDAEPDAPGPAAGDDNPVPPTGGSA